MEMYRCASCMGEIKPGQKICPRCGFDAEKYRQPPHAMRMNSILAGRYLIGRVLGQGGFGITYVGYDLKLELKVAIKEYYPGNQAERNHNYSNNISWSLTSTQLQDWKQGVDRFLNEARKMARLDSLPGIIRVRDSFQENQTAYIVMDFAEGITLKKYLEENGPMDYRTCVEMLLPVMDSLEVMHDKGLIHRDISPDNIMIRKIGKRMDVKLLDFGAAADLSRNRGRNSESVVKRGYSAPEQYLENGNIGRYTDVYAIACVIYRCVSGNQPPEAMERVMKKTTLTLEGIKSKKAQEVLAHALALNADERTQSMAELKKELQGTISSGNKSVGKVIAGVAAVAVCLVGVALAVTRPWEDTVEVVVDPETETGTEEEEAVTIVTMGTTNSNMCQGTCCASISNQYLYYIDAEWNLRLAVYDEDGKVYPGGDDVMVVDDEASNIVVGGDKVYFIHDNNYMIGEDEPEVIYSINPDGSGKTILMTGNHDYGCLQYVELSTGEEMLYFWQQMEDADDETNDYLHTLCRYNLDTGETEQLLTNVSWYNLDGQYIYYVTFTMDELGNTKRFMRANLDGSNEELLNDSDYINGGYIEDGKGWLFSGKSQELLAYDLDKNTLEAQGYSKTLFSSVSVYHNGWIYYSESDTGKIYKVLADGKGDPELIYSGSEEICFMTYCDIDNSIWFMTLERNDTDIGYQILATRLFSVTWDQVLDLEE